MDPEIPEALRKTHPELEQIHAAIAEFRQTGIVTTRCPRCQEPIKVVEVPGRLVANCQCGLCSYSAKFDIDAVPRK